MATALPFVWDSSSPNLQEGARFQYALGAGLLRQAVRPTYVLGRFARIMLLMDHQPRNSSADFNSAAPQDQQHESETTAAPSSIPSDTRDLTKTRAYVTIDLVLRTLTALGVVV